MGNCFTKRLNFSQLNDLLWLLRFIHLKNDRINFFTNLEDGIMRKCLPFYEKGLSCRGVAKLTGYPRSSIQEVFRAEGMLRRPRSGSLNFDKKKTFRLIKELIEQGLSPPSIAQKLNAKGLKSRTGKEWSRHSVRHIVKSLHLN